LGSLKVIVVDVEVLAVPFNVTDQDVPDGSPDSVNVTVYGVGSTSRLVMLVALWPTESLAKTLIVNVPVTLGTHIMTVKLEDAQPGGKPVYAYFSTPTPPEADTVKLVGCPTTTGSTEAEKEEMIGPVGVLTIVMIAGAPWTVTPFSVAFTKRPTVPAVVPALNVT
jgi:hypothetical protein